MQPILPTAITVIIRLLMLPAVRCKALAMNLQVLRPLLLQLALVYLIGALVEEGRGLGAGGRDHAAAADVPLYHSSIIWHPVLLQERYLALRLVQCVFYRALHIIIAHRSTIRDHPLLEITRISADSSIHLAIHVVSSGINPIVQDLKLSLNLI